MIDIQLFIDQLTERQYVLDWWIDSDDDISKEEISLVQYTDIVTLFNINDRRKFLGCSVYNKRVWPKELDIQICGIKELESKDWVFYSKELPLQDWYYTTRISAAIHTTHNKVRQEDIKQHIEYNSNWRFGQSLFVEGKCVYIGYHTLDQARKLEEEYQIPYDTQYRKPYN